MDINERLGSVFLDWWWHAPLNADEEATVDTALDDLRSLMTHLEAHGFQIVETANYATGGPIDSDKPLMWGEHGCN